MRFVPSSVEKRNALPLEVSATRFSTSFRELTQNFPVCG